MIEYCVVSRDKNCLFCGGISGHGKNKGTLDSSHSRSAAYRLAREMRQRADGKTYKVETIL